MRIVVVVSTWNGSLYVVEQIQSILDQACSADLAVLVRDDGSTDRTVELIRSIGDSRVRLVQGENIGVKASFLALLTWARELDPDFVALADQDDLWLPGKLEHGIQRLAPLSSPALYCSALTVVDEFLDPLALYISSMKPSFKAALIKNCAAGCTCVINKQLLSLLDVLPRPSEIVMHDWWLFLVSSAFGTIEYDKTPRIFYRQHASNVVGRRTGVAGMAQRALRTFTRRRHPGRYSQAREFARIYRDLITGGQARHLENFIQSERQMSLRVRVAAETVGSVGLRDYPNLATYMVGL